VSGPVSHARRFLVRGRVQGVGFRYFVLVEARSLRLTGFTRNLPDGNVEVQAAGEFDELDALARVLEQGPALSRVDGVTVQELETVPAWSEFKINN
jgi:acylphosphatase